MDVVQSSWSYDGNPRGRLSLSPRDTGPERRATTAPFISVDDDGRLWVCPEFRRMLADVHDSIVIAAVGGVYRGGKDYLVNALAGVNDAGFAVSATALRQTKGIWAWLKPHPMVPGDSLLVLDLDLQDGLNQVDHEVDNYLTVMALLLSCEFIWCTTASPLGDRLDFFQFLSNLPAYVTMPSRAASPPRPDTRGKGGGDLFPVFSLCLWDSAGPPLKAVEDHGLLERVLEERAADGAAGAADFDLRRDLLAAHFPHHLCFSFPLPTTGRADCERLPESRLESALLESARLFTRHVLQGTGAKFVRGVRLNGALLVLLAEQLCSTQRAGFPLCVAEAMSGASRLSNDAACLRAARLYRDLLTPPVGETLPLLDTDSRHENAVREARKLYAMRSVLDHGFEHERRLAELMAEARREVLQEADEASGRRCRQRLRELYADVSGNIREEAFTRPGGHNVYTRLMDDLKRRYGQTPDLGGEMDRVLSLFLKEKHEEDRLIFTVDKIITFLEKDKHRVEEEAKCLVERQMALEELGREQQNLINSLTLKIENLEQYAVEAGWSCPVEIPKRNRDSCTIL